ncbi:MAG: hypothetical protein U9P44_00810 [archaeon]|nr:hypothetical protein [archaeon]
MKWKCKKCKKEIKIENGTDKKHTHKIEKYGDKYKCSKCNTFFEPPMCHDEPMYIAS